MTGGAALSVQEEQQPWGYPVLMVQESEMPQLHVLLLVRQEVSDPPASVVRHAQLGEVLP